MKVEIYGTPTCGYCVQSKNMCESYGVSHTYYDLIDTPAEKAKLEERLGNTVTTVPQIFIDGEYLPGGYSSLRTKLSNSG